MLGRVCSEDDESRSEGLIEEYERKRISDEQEAQALRNKMQRDIIELRESYEREREEWARRDKQQRQGWST